MTIKNKCDALRGLLQLARDLDKSCALVQQAIADFNGTGGAADTTTS
jgi:hypothetical protein